MRRRRSVKVLSYGIIDVTLEAPDVWILVVTEDIIEFA